MTSDLDLTPVQPIPTHIPSVGPVVALIPIGYDRFAVVCHRPHMEVHRAYSTHEVTCGQHADGSADYTVWVAYWGHYDKSQSDAIRDMITRAGYAGGATS